MGPWGHEGCVCFQENSEGRRGKIVDVQNEHCVPDITPAQRIDGKMCKLESESRDTLRSLAYRRISVHESAVVVWV